MMQPLSAADAISPAWRHTRSFLLTPRRWQTLLKICAVAFFANMSGFSGSFKQPLHAGHGGHMPAQIAALWMGFAVVFGVLFLAFALALFYVSSRLQFVLFESVLRRDTTVGPIWSRYGAAAWRWMALKLMFLIAVLVCLAPVLIPFIIHFVRSVPKGQPAPAEFGHFFATVLGFVAIVFAVSMVVGVVYVLVADLGLPSMALESTGYGETLARVGRLIRAETGQVALYVFLRMLLGFAGVLAGEMAVGLAALIALVPFGGTGFVLWKAMHGHGIASTAAMGLMLAVLAIVFAALVVCAALIALGYVFTFLQAYALYFLGGRYPLLGSYLEPALPETLFRFVPPGWSPAYYPPQAPPSAL